MSQFFSNSLVPRHPSAHAMASRLFPVNNSAPATTTSSRPSEKTTPPSTRESAKLKEASLATSVKYIAPNPMKAPASMASIHMVNKGNRALTTHTSLTRSATCLGE